MPHSRRVAPAVILVAAAVFAFGACAPTPAGPSPASSSPAPLTDEEAFAAAEETYRDYVDALNEVDLSDPATFEPVFDLTTGELHESDRRGLTRYHADGVSIEGTSKIVLIEPRQRADNQVHLDVCLDVSTVALRDLTGQPLVDPARANVQQLVVTVSTAEPAGGHVTLISGRDDGTPC